MEDPRSLTIAVGALPRNISGWSPSDHYALSWSVDGLVNEYIRPCNIKSNGLITQVPALSVRSNVYIDGTKYEMAYTSGGVGSLVTELDRVPNVRYATIRYPGHYDWVDRVVAESRGQFDAIRKIFVETFPYTTDDVIVAYAEARGYDRSGKYVMNTFSDRFYGINGLTAIQSTTAAGGVAMLELMTAGTVGGIVTHTSVSLDQFKNTVAYKQYYFGSTAA
jgi:saccharopine dehydrogenase-like NADP-dependent oxidoreductase